MPSKRAHSGTGVRPAFGSGKAEPDDEIALNDDEPAPADGCPWCTGRYAGDVKHHDAACPAGRAAKRAARRLNGLD